MELSSNKVSQSLYLTQTNSHLIGCPARLITYIVNNPEKISARNLKQTIR